MESLAGVGDSGDGADDGVALGIQGAGKCVGVSHTLCGVGKEDRTGRREAVP